jgi:UDP-N-acetylmuramate dehydrogenase
VITSVGLTLRRSGRPHLAYAGLSDRLAGVPQPSSLQVAEAVSALRSEKLPDPSIEGNAGSFFKNPELPRDAVQPLLLRYPSIPWYAGQQADQVKLSAAWLIERLGWKGHRRGDAGISARHALVLVNHGSASGWQLLELAREVAESVRVEFGIRLEPEPRIIGAGFWPPS